jgi:23S rRNA pseudouridine955/2504/2580 synthase
MQKKNNSNNKFKSNKSFKSKKSYNKDYKSKEFKSDFSFEGKSSRNEDEIKNHKTDKKRDFNKKFDKRFDKKPEQKRKFENNAIINKEDQNKEAPLQVKLNVINDYAGITLIKYLKKVKIGVPYSLLQKLLRKRAIKVNGQRVKEDFILSADDEIIIPANSSGKVKKPNYIASEEDAKLYIKDNIIYEDENCIAINKPFGLASQGGSKVKLSVDILLPFIQKDKKQRFVLVHRLDKDTTGILLIAKNLEAARILGESFKHKFIEKKYLALVAGRVLDYNGVIDKPLGKRGAAGGVEKIIVDEEGGKKAYTEYKVIKSFGSVATLLEVTPYTGRKHQIRVHLASIGHPIIGDGKYGGSKSFVKGLPKQIHLHAWKLRHTENYFKGVIEAKAPKYFDIDM